MSKTVSYKNNLNQNLNLENKVATTDYLCSFFTLDYCTFTNDQTWNNSCQLMLKKCSTQNSLASDPIVSDPVYSLVSDPKSLVSDPSDPGK